MHLVVVLQANKIKQNMAKILIIDDERAIRNTLREILEYEDYAVEDVDNGIDGLELYKKTTMTWFFAISK